MARGEKQKGKRRGKYKRRGDGVLELAPETPPKQKRARRLELTIGPEDKPEKQRRLSFELPVQWTDEDVAHFERLFVESPLLNLGTRENSARRATELARQLRELDARGRTVDEEKVMVSASGQYRRWLENLQVAEKTVEDDEPL